MEWTDEAIVIGTRRHGEGNLILETMTRVRGRHLGLVRGGAGARLRPLLQPGNSVRAVWRARLDEHLGVFAVEATKLRAATFLAWPYAVYGVTHLAALARLLAEREPHAGVYAALETVLDFIAHPHLTAALVIRFELMVLAELGFGLELERCAATGTREGLVYVSPRSGRAVAQEPGAPWRDRLLPLPAFVVNGLTERMPTGEELDHGFALSGYFLTRRVLDPRNEDLAIAREGFIGAVRRAIAQENAQENARYSP